MSAYSLIAGSRDEKRVRDLTHLIRKIVWTTQRIGAPGKLEFDLLKGENAYYLEGDRVDFSVDGIRKFRGYVFTKEKNQKGEIHTVCYDQLRYLKARQSYVFSGRAASYIVKKVAADFGLKTGTIVDSKYTIPALLVDDKTCLDTIYNALELTAAGGGGKYNFYDEAGCLVLRAVSGMYLPHVLGDKSFAGAYTYRTSIDDEVYNYIKLLRPDAEAGRGLVHVAKSDETIGRWGFLQYYAKVDEELNAAQMKEQAKNLLLSYNRLQRRLRLEALGIPEIRAGNSVRVQIAGLGDISLSQWLLADKAVHTFDPYHHHMELEFALETADDSIFAVSYDSFQEAIPQTTTSSSSSQSDASGGSGYKYPHHSGYQISCPYGKKGASWACGWHSGTDYVGAGSKKIYAVASGKVIKAGWDGSYGKSIRILHDDGYLSLYGHLSAIQVAVGDRVGNGTFIGVEGSTGNASGSHLHLEIHKGSYHYPSSIDPHQHIKSRLD